MHGHDSNSQHASYLNLLPMSSEAIPLGSHQWFSELQVARTATSMAGDRFD